VRTLCKRTGYFPDFTLAYSFDSQQLAVADVTRDIRAPGGKGTYSRWSAVVFNPGTGQELFHVLDSPVPSGGPTYRLIDAAFSPDRSRLAVLCTNNDEYQIRVVDCLTQQALVTFRRPPAGPGQLFGSIGFCADGRRLALALATKEGSRFVEVCDAAAGTSSFVVNGINFLPAITCDGRRLAAIRYPSQVQLLDTVSGQAVTVVDKPADGVVSCVAFSGDSRRLATASRSIGVYDTGSGRELSRFQPGIDIDVVALSPDGKRLAIGGGPGIITLWDTTTGQEVLALRGHSAGIKRLAFSPDGRFLASASEDGTVKLWEASIGAVISDAW
jgi:WD40 repeat protein